MTATSVAVAPDRRGALQVVARLGWGVADQAVSSLSNFALGLYVARTFGASALGAFTVAYFSYALVINAARGVGTDPLLVRYSGAAVDRWRKATASATGTALVAGAASGVVCLVAGLLLPDPVGSAFLALSVGLPGLALQDSWRFAFFAAARAKSALVNDLVWSLSLLVLLLDREGSVVRCLLAFGATGTLAALFGAVQARVLPRPAAAVAWVREHRQLSWRYLTENVGYTGATSLRSFVVGAVAGLAVVGYVRSAEMLMGPFFVLLMGVGQVAVPEAARVFHRSPARLAHFCFAVGATEAAAALAWGGTLMLVLPLGPGHALLHDLWDPTSQLLPALTVNVMAMCFSTSATAGVRAMGASRRSLRAQLTGAALYLVGGIGGVFVAGAAGTAWGVTVAVAVSALIWWHQLRAALRQHRLDLVAQEPSREAADR